MIIRIATKNDAQQLLDIYAPYVLDSTFTFEYDIPSLQTFEQRITTTLQTHPYLVAEDNNRILGYAYAHPLNEREAYQWTAELSVYVGSTAKGRGVGKQLYQALEQYLKEQNVIQTIAVITAENTRSIAFHEHFGYHQVGQLTQVGFKHGKWLDVAWLQKSLSTPTDTPAPFIPFSQLIYRA